MSLNIMDDLSLITFLDFQKILSFFSKKQDISRQIMGWPRFSPESFESYRGVFIVFHFF